jgi:hypothetical protein
MKDSVGVVPSPRAPDDSRNPVSMITESHMTWMLTDEAEEKASNPCYFCRLGKRGVCVLRPCIS